MRQVSFEMPGDALVGLKAPLEEAAATVRIAAAMKFYEIGRLSSSARGNDGQTLPAGDRLPLETRNTLLTILTPRETYNLYVPHYTAFV